MEGLESLLKKLCEAAGPSGQEGPIRDLIANEIKPYCTDLKADPMGNLIAGVGAEDGYKVGILAHMDEVGFIVSKISERGLIGFEQVGDIDPKVLMGCEVDILAENMQRIRGVIGNKSRHLQSPEEAGSPMFPKQLWIDVGANSFEDILDRGINIGSGIVFATQFRAYQNGVILGKALDDRIGCAILIGAIKELSKTLRSTILYGMFTCQEEIGAKGAQVIAFDSRPEMTITLDTVPAKNPEEVGPRDVDINRGPVIRLFDWHPSTELGMCTHPYIKNRLIETAKKEGIKHQIDVLTSTYLDSSQVHLTAGGIPGGSLCIPRRYAHSQVELGHLSDVRESLRLLVALIKSLDKDPIRFTKSY